jgi:hypothetical protein
VVDRPAEGHDHELGYPVVASALSGRRRRLRGFICGYQMTLSASVFRVAIAQTQCVAKRSRLPRKPRRCSARHGKSPDSAGQLRSKILDARAIVSRAGVLRAGSSLT